MSIRFFATVTAGVAVLVAAGSGSASGGAATRLPTLEQRLVIAINDVRDERGAAPLSSHPALARAAIVHTREMARLGVFSHQSAEGTSMRRRVARYYPRGPNPRRWDVGENLQWRAGSSSAPAFVLSWLESGQHRSNLLGPKFRDVGVAAVHVEDARGAFGNRTITLVTVVFGVR